MVGLPGVSSCVAWTKTVTNNAKTHHGIDLPVSATWVTGGCQMDGISTGNFVYLFP